MKNLYKKLFYGLLCIGAPIFAHAQTCTYPTNISTIAGMHVEGFSGDGFSATGATMGSPYAVAVAANGDVYVADFFNNVVRRIDKINGNIYTIAGTGVAGYNGDDMDADQAQLNGPAGLYVDNTGNLYIADKYNERIRKVDINTNTITTIAGNGLHGGLNGIDFGDDGMAVDAALTYPVALTMDCNGNMYVADNGSQTVRKIDGATGIITRYAGNHTGGFAGDDDFAVSAQLYAPSAVAADCDGNVFIADSWNNRIRKVDANGIITTYAGTGDTTYGGDGDSAKYASIWNPWGITLDQCGNLFVCDYNNNVVRMIDGATQEISTFAGSNTRGYTGDDGDALSAAIYLPVSVAVDADDKVYIADYGNYVIRMMGTSPIQPLRYANGTTQNLEVNMNSNFNSVSNLMSVPNTTAGNTVTWTVGRLPENGTLTGFPASVITTGSVVVPTNITYTPKPGFKGNDEFTVIYNDGTNKAATTVTVKVAEPTGIKNIANANGAAVVPNPSNGTFAYSFQSEGNNTLNLVATDVTGRIIYKQIVNAVAGGNTVNVTLPSTAQGLIMVSLSNGNVTYPAIKVTVAK